MNSIANELREAATIAQNRAKSDKTIGLVTVRSETAFALADRIDTLETALHEVVANIEDANDATIPIKAGRAYRIAREALGQSDA